MDELECAEHPAAGEISGSRREETLVAQRSDRGGGLIRYLVDIAQVYGRHRGKVAFLREIGPLGVGDAGGQLGDEEVQVGIALAVRVRAHVDRHAIDKGRQIGAVIEIDAAQEVLIGFPLSAVDRDHETGHGFQQLGRPKRGELQQFLAQDDSFAGRRGDADQLGTTRRDDDDFGRFVGHGFGDGSCVLGGCGEPQERENGCRPQKNRSTFPKGAWNGHKKLPSHPQRQGIAFPLAATPRLTD